MTETKTHTLDVPGATLRYDVRDAEPESAAPVLLMIASPMDASGFNTLAGHFSDRTVVTYDPRGVGRSERTDGATWATPDEHAQDLHRLISALGAGPVDIFASSGGAVNALALVARHPEQVRTLVAHEPPSAQVLPDREQMLAAVADVLETYERDGLGPGMAKFIALTNLKGPIPTDYLDQPPPNPAHTSGCRPRTMAAATIRCSAGTSSRSRITSPTSRHCAPRRPGSLSEPEPNRRAG
jgi:pimeloyl-ACP methyl ester carboxylesterase